MKAIKINNQIRIGVPKFWTLKDGSHVFAFDKRADQVHFDEGFGLVIKPVAGVDYDPDTQRLGAIYQIENSRDFTYPIVDIPEEEIKNRIASQAESNREMIIQEKLKAQVENQLQEIVEDQEVMKVKDAYPLWSSFPDQFPFPQGFKVQDFEGKELKLFRIIQPHNKQSDRVPILTPALWTKIEFSQGLEVWSQPTGGDGKYPYLNPDTGQPYQVSHKSQTWVNTNKGSLNVWEPGVFGWEVV